MERITGQNPQKFGHDTRIMATKYVDPYRTKGKSDFNDAVTICEPVQRPLTRVVLKSAEQQAILSIHRV